MSAQTEQRATVLVVDDNEDNRLIALTNLELAGYRVLEADGGEAALAILAESPADLVLLDIMMPGLNGYEVCRRIRADQALRDVKVLMLTAKAATADILEGFGAGADDYVTKPFEIDELLARVGNLVGLKRAQDELRRINADLEGEVERRALELARSEARYRTIFNAVPISIMLLDPEGRIEAVNAWHEQHPLFAWLYGPPLVGQQLAEHRGAEAVGFASCVTPLLEGCRFEHQARLHAENPEGNRADVRVRGVPIRSDDGTAQGAAQGALVLHEDLTEERRLQERVLEAQKLASIGTLAQGVAHNFNNLLFVVTGSLEILRAALSGERCKMPFDQARTALTRMAALTRQLSTFSRIGEEEFRPVKVAELLADVLSAFRPALGDKIRLELDAPDDLPPVNGCPGELYQAFQGLVQNAIEALPDGGHVRVSARLDHRVLPGLDALRPVEHPCVVCEIADSGIGMDEETRRRATEPFFTTKQTVGVGLGLSASHGIVRSHGGLFEITSTPCKGTSVTVALPACDELELQAAALPKHIVKAE
jgi:signal transduction histidine kinase